MPQHRDSLFLTADGAKERADMHFNAFLHEAFTPEQRAVIDWDRDTCHCDQPIGAFKYHWKPRDCVEVRLTHASNSPLEGTGIECNITRGVDSNFPMQYEASLLVRRRPLGHYERVFTFRVLNEGGPTIVYDTATGTIRMIGDATRNAVGRKFLEHLLPDLFTFGELTKDPKVFAKVIENVVFTGESR